MWSWCASGLSHTVWCNMPLTISNEHCGNHLSIFFSALHSLHMTLEKMGLHIFELPQKKEVVCAEQYFSRAFTRRKWMWGGPGKTCRCYHKNNSYSAKHSGSFHVYVQRVLFSLDVNTQMYVTKTPSEVLFFYFSEFWFLVTSLL